MGSLPLATINEVLGSSATPEEKAIGQEILTTSIFAILVCAPLGVMLINFTREPLLERMEVELPARHRGPPSLAKHSAGVQTDWQEGGEEGDEDDDEGGGGGEARDAGVGGGEDGGDDGGAQHIKPEDRLKQQMLEESYERRKRRELERREGGGAMPRALSESAISRLGADGGTGGEEGAASIGGSPGFSSPGGGGDGGWFFGFWGCKTSKLNIFWEKNRLGRNLLGCEVENVWVWVGSWSVGWNM